MVIAGFLYLGWKERKENAQVEVSDRESETSEGVDEGMGKDGGAGTAVREVR